MYGEPHVKAIGNYKLAALTGFAALGLLAAVVAHAQAPSGPIPPAPAQPAPGRTSPNASNPAPAPPPRTTILGAWKFNPDDSDDPRKRRQNSQDSNGGFGGGRGRIGGGETSGWHAGHGRRPHGAST